MSDIDNRNKFTFIDAGGVTQKNFMVVEDCFLVAIAYQIGLLPFQDRVYLSIAGDLSNPIWMFEGYINVVGSESFSGVVPCRIPLRYNQPLQIQNDPPADVCRIGLLLEPLDQ